MPKIFQFDNEKVDRKNRAEAMDAAVWFEAQQPLLLWMANKSKDGRKLLRLDQTNLDRIDRIAMNYVGQDEYVKDGGTLFRPQYRRVSTTDFRVGAKWANLVNSQWDWFCELAREYYALMEQKKLDHIGQFLPVALYRGMAYGTTSTFYPDPNVESTSVDGYVQYVSDPTWATVRGAADGTAAFDSVADDQNNSGSLNAGNYFIVRGFYLFDSSAITDTDTIDSAVLSLFGTTSVSNTDTTDVDVVASTPASNTALVTGDYDQVGTTVFASIALSGYSTTAYNDFTLDANGRNDVSKTGVSKFGTRNSRDTDNSAPTGINRAYSYFADQAGTTNDPKLVVTHTAVATFFPTFNIIM